MPMNNIYLVVWKMLPEVAFSNRLKLDAYLKKEKLGTFEQIKQDMENGMPSHEVYELELKGTAKKRLKRMVVDGFGGIPEVAYASRSAFEKSARKKYGRIMERMEEVEDDEFVYEVELK